MEHSFVASLLVILRLGIKGDLLGALLSTLIIDILHAFWNLVCGRLLGGKYGDFCTIPIHHWWFR